MNILVINSGSSSIKYQLFSMPREKTVCCGLVERIGTNDAVITHKIFTSGQEDRLSFTLSLRTHEDGLHEIARLLTDKVHGVIQDPKDIDAVGHRVVHGGESFKATIEISLEVKEKIKELFPLAPLHNPANFLGIEVAEKIFSGARQVAVFDTAFYHSIPEKAFRYAIPEHFYVQNRIRAYGFHGTSHKYVSKIATEYLGKPQSKIISIHLGNGCSITAISNGMAVDTSMGFGPLSGLIMGTRSGDIDASVIFHLISQLGFTPNEVSDLLNKKSGMLGLTGMSDMRDIHAAVEGGSQNAALALEMYAYRIKKYIGAYTAVLNGLDAIVFTAGVGENASYIRRSICENLEYLGINLDPQKNAERSNGFREINKKGASVSILVIPTNEELEIVQQCYDLLLKNQKNAF
jgi:acetate kinase